MMTHVLIVLAVVTWLVIGAWSHVYWVRNKYDYTSEYLPDTAFGSLIGPIAFWAGWIVYSDPPRRPPKCKVLLRKRTRT